MAGALAAASRALADSDPAMAAEAWDAAKVLWGRYQKGPIKSGDGRDDSGAPWSADGANVGATVEMLITSKGERVYADRLRALMPVIAKNFAWVRAPAVRAIPFMDAQYRAALVPLVRQAKVKMDAEAAKTPSACRSARATGPVRIRSSSSDRPPS